MHLKCALGINNLKTIRKSSLLTSKNCLPDILKMDWPVLYINHILFYIWYVLVHESPNYCSNKQYLMQCHIPTYHFALYQNWIPKIFIYPNSIAIIIYIFNSIVAFCIFSSLNKIKHEFQNFNCYCFAALSILLYNGDAFYSFSIWMQHISVHSTQ